MRKLIFLLSASLVLAGCGSGEESQNGENQESQGTVEEDVENEKTLNTEGESESLTAEQLEERIHMGMDFDTYTAEITAWADKGQAEVIETVPVSNGREAVSADIIQVSNGFLAVSTDGQEVTDVKVFVSAEEAQEYLSDPNYKNTEG